MTVYKKAATTALFCAGFLFVFFLYLTSMSASYNCDDSPETITAFYTLGIQHPPGYPLITMAGKVFLNAPLGGIMFRANLFSAFLNLAAAFALYLLAKRVLACVSPGRTANAAAAVAAAFIYALSASSWLQGTIAKGAIYSFNSLLTVLFLLALVRIREGMKFFYLFAFLYGLSMANHWTSSAVMAPAVLLYLFMVGREKQRAPDRQAFFSLLRASALGALFFIAGASVYYFVFVRSASMPVYAWGDIKSLKDLYWLVSRAQYSSIEVRHTLADTFSLLRFYAMNALTREFPAGTVVALIPGAWMLYRKKPAEAVLLAFAYLLLVASVASFATPPQNTEWLIKPYLVSSNIFAALFIAAFFSGAAALFGGAYRKITMAVLGLYCALFVFNTPDYGNNYIGYDYSKNLMKTAPAGALIYAEGDMNIGALLYESLVNRRPFVPVIPVVIQYEWYRQQLSRNYGGRVRLGTQNQDMRLYIDSFFAGNLDKPQYYTVVYNPGWTADISLQHEGLLFKMATRAQRAFLNDVNFNLYSYRGAFGNKAGHDEFTQRLVLDNYGASYFYFGDILRQNNNNAAAAAYYRRGLLFAKNESAMINLGLAYFNMNDMAAAEKIWREALNQNPRSSIIYSNLAFIYASKKDYVTARTMLNTALRLDPGNISAQQLLMQVNRQ
jgi:tetratricopeptide (TPR) repeat protein